MRIRKSTKIEVQNQLRIVRRSLPKNMAKYELIDPSLAQRMARAQLDKLLKGEDNRFFTAHASGSVMGYLWLVERAEEVFVTYVYVLRRFRRKGCAAKLVRWAESYAARSGAKRLALHVFARNVAAINLYEKCGFITSNVKMLKPL